MLGRRERVRERRAVGWRSFILGFQVEVGGGEFLFVGIGCFSCRLVWIFLIHLPFSTGGLYTQCIRSIKLHAKALA